MIIWHNISPAWQSSGSEEESEFFGQLTAVISLPPSYLDDPDSASNRFLQYDVVTIDANDFKEDFITAHKCLIGKRLYWDNKVWTIDDIECYADSSQPRYSIYITVLGYEEQVPDHTLD